MMDFNTQTDLGQWPVARGGARDANAPATPEDAARARRVLTVLRFLTTLSDSSTDEELLRTVLQAAAVWYDIEASAYRRDATGTFVLDAWLPGVDVSGRPVALPASLVSALGEAPTLVSSVADIEEIGWPDSAGDVVLLPITYGGRQQSILAIGGVLDDEMMAAVGAVGQALGAALHRRYDRERAGLEQRLRTALEQPNRADGEIAASILETLITHLPAAGAQLVVESAQSADTLAAVASAAQDRASDRAADTLSVSLPLDEGRSFRLTFNGVPGVPMRPMAIAAVEASAAIVRQWLRPVSAPGARPPLPSAFEQRIDEEVTRARRFGLELVILLIAPAFGGIPKVAEQTLTEAVREGLRGSDLVGTIGGEIAVILVHTGMHGARSVEERLKTRLQTVVRERQLPSLTIGEGGFPSGGDSAAALLSKARTQQIVLLNGIGTVDGH